MTRDRRLLLAVGLNAIIVVVQAVFGWRAHSLGLVADAAHNLTDIAALCLSLWALRLTRRSPTGKQSFGYHRSGILAAQANAALILVATAFIFYEAFRRLSHPVPVEGSIVVVVASVALIANGLAVWALTDDGHDLNMRSAVLHMAGDAAASVGVIVAGVVILATGRFFRLDPLVSIGVGAIIAWRAVSMLRETTDILMEATPRSLDRAALLEAIAASEDVEGVHDLHAWSLSSHITALSAHIVLAGHPSLEVAQTVGQRIKDMLLHDFAVGHATLELECEPCADHEIDCLPVALTTRPGHRHGSHSGH